MQPENALYYKHLINSSAKSAKVIVILESKQVLEKRGYHITIESIVITADNRKAYREIIEIF